MPNSPIQMTRFGNHLSYFLSERQIRRSVGTFVRYLVFLLGVIVLYTVFFHVIMWSVEGRVFTWTTGLYWTLTTMSTLGYGDVTFDSDAGRLYSIWVMASGLILLLIVLPFTFIRHFYAPWLEAQIRSRAPRDAPRDVAGHVIICGFDDNTPGLIARLDRLETPYFVIEPELEAAARLLADGISVVAGQVDSPETYRRLQVEKAGLVLANLDDVTNTNITLTVREVAPDTPVAAFVSNEDSIDILGLAGCTHVLPLRRRLGEQLADRVNEGHAQAHVIGFFRDLLVAEFSVLNTPFMGRTVRDTRLRENIGLNVVGVREHAHLLPASPDTVLTELTLVVVLGTQEQIDELNEILYIYDTNHNPVVVIGGGKVGRAVTHALRRKGIRVHLIEQEERLRPKLEEVADRLFIGDAAHFELLMEAGLDVAPTVLLTTNDDAMNIYLAVYCRRLRPDARIVSRITHERNVASIQRAGADLALSYAGLVVETITSLLRGDELVALGDGLELHRFPVPGSVAGKTLAEAGIGARTGMNVVAIEDGATVVTGINADSLLPAGADLMMIGTEAQLARFREEFQE